MTSDPELVAQVIARAPGAFEQLVQANQTLVWHLVYRMVQHPEDARELSQEVFLRVHQNLHQFRFDSSLATWIGRIAFSVASRHLEKKRIALVESDDEAEVGPMIERIEDPSDLESAQTNQQLLARLSDLMQALPPVQRTLITLFHVEELSLDDIAEMTELPVGTVKNYLFRARQRLRQQLEKEHAL